MKIVVKFCAEIRHNGTEYRTLSVPDDATNEEIKNLCDEVQLGIPPRSYGIRSDEKFEVMDMSNYLYGDGDDEDGDGEVWTMDEERTWKKAK